MEARTRKVVFEMYKERLIRAATDARENAVSYRGFRVGAALLAWNHFCGEYRIFVGANMKPLADGPKICAEQVAVGAARADGWTTVVAIVVVAEAQPDEKSGVCPKTLHPCWVCRKFFRPEVGVTHETIVYTMDPKTGLAEEQAFGEILRIHDGL